MQIMTGGRSTNNKFAGLFLCTARYLQLWKGYNQKESFLPKNYGVYAFQIWNNTVLDE